MLIVIPARYNSSRFPGKPLAQILGKSLIQWTWEAARKVPEAEVVIATDHNGIQKTAEAFGASVIRTSPMCRNGTERVAEAVRLMDWHDPTSVVVNWQGDALLIPPSMVTDTVELMEASDVDMMTPIIDVTDWPDEEPVPEGHVEAIMDESARALWFARGQVFAGPMWAHVGLYVYSTPALLAYARWQASPVEIGEGLEQLRWLVEGAAVGCATFTGPVPCEVNYPRDVPVVETILRARGV
jgi:3-deoxy-manno-octulosonate cytidylyltransferase (CMP-KDO synthetase)